MLHEWPEVHQSKFFLSISAVATGRNIVKASHYQHPQRVISFYKASIWNGLCSSSVSMHYGYHPAKETPSNLLPGDEILTTGKSNAEHMSNLGMELKGLKEHGV